MAIENISSKHPEYDNYSDEWETLRDFLRGEPQVKRKAHRYLPPTAGMKLDGYPEIGAPGTTNYMNYIHRAVFHNFPLDAQTSMISILHAKPPVIELPEAMQPLMDKATKGGLSLSAFLQKVNMEQIAIGRVGIMADLPEKGGDVNAIPLLSTYTGESIINWDDGEFDKDYQTFNLVVLNESGKARVNGFDWEMRERYRVLRLAGNETDDTGVPTPQGDYEQCVFDKDGVLATENWKTPVIGGRPAPRIPFVIINACDVHSSPDAPPLSSLAALTAAIYRAEADYRQNLFMQGQDTLVVKGIVRSDDGKAPLRTGAGARIEVESEHGDAKFIGVSGQGLPEQRQALESDKSEAVDRSMQLISVRRTQRESGEALHTRVAARTVTLRTLALAGAAGLQQILRTIAEWKGLDPQTVKVTPNLDFADDSTSSKEFVELLTARAQGLPLSYQSLHTLMVDRGFTTMDYEEELALVKKEGIIALPGANPGGDPTGSGRVAAQQSGTSPSPGATT